jgi:hypothetical protein
MVIANAATQRADGPSPPVARDDAGWITVRPKHYLGASLADSLQLSTETINAPFVRIVGLKGPGSIRITSNNGTLNASDIAVMFCKGNATIGGSPTTKNGVWGEWDRFYFNDNWLIGDVSTINLRAWDSEAIGNFCQNTLEDSYKCAMLNRVVGSGKSKFWFNVAVDKKAPGPPAGPEGAHVDFTQFHYTTDSMPYAVANPGQYEHASMFGNVMMRGEGSYNLSISTPNAYERDGQGIFCNDPGGCTFIVHIRGCIVVSNMNNGVFWNNAVTGSKVEYCTVAPPYDIVGQPWGTSLGSPRIDMRGTAAGTMEVNNCILSGSVRTEGSAVITQTNNLPGISSREAAVTLFADPLTINVLPDLPVMLAKMATINPAHADKGATNDPLINIRQRWVSPELLP